ncbi:hypothetical protein UFOVP48_58 [uncultured Caudovirales phage]|uniref:Uncharacterized protein n=1 Tax=uncultured Caudovirales phage TaxID=2100421 RepID=A0A6J5KRY8_9CAUD|nr:hypothetical protein UFOVP48_58 [uncultured Caudovirales phage]
MAQAGLGYFKKHPGTAHFDEGGGAGGEGGGGEGGGGEGRGESGDSGESSSAPSYSADSTLANLGLAAIAPTVSPAPTAAEQAAADKATAVSKPGEDAMSAATANAYAKMSPEQMSNMAATLGVPSSYNFNDPGFKEGLIGLGLDAKNLAVNAFNSIPQVALAKNLYGVVSGDVAPMAAVQNVFSTIPQLGLLNAALKFATGQTTVGDTAASMAMSAVAKQLGISPAVAQAALSGDMGEAVKSAAISTVTKDAAKDLGLSPSMIAQIGAETGVTNDLGASIKNAINGITGDTSTGVNQASIANSVNNALASLSPSEAANATAPTDFGGAPSTGMASADNSGTAGTNIAATPAASSGTTTAATPTASSAGTQVAANVPDNVARAGTGFDVGADFDPSWFSHYVAQKSNGLIANPVKIASGGYLDSLLAQPTSVEDLLRTLRK